MLALLLHLVALMLQPPQSVTYFHQAFTTPLFLYPYFPSPSLNSLLPAGLPVIAYPCASDSATG